MNTNGFTSVPNFIVNNNNLSLRAKAIYMILASNSKDWQVNLKEISSRSIESYDVHRNAINELIKAGLVERTQIKNKDGQFSNFKYNVVPCDEIAHSAKIHMRNVHIRNIHMRKSDQYNNTNSKENQGIIIQKENNTKEINVNVNKDPEVECCRERQVSSGSSFMEKSDLLKNDLIEKVKSNPVIVFMDTLLKKFPSYIEQEIQYLILGVQKYLLKDKQRGLEINDVKFIFDLFIRENNDTIYYVCLTYNDESVHGSHGIGYVKGILNKCKEDLLTRNNLKNAEEIEKQKLKDRQQRILDDYAAQKIESNKEFGNELATGKIESKRTYDAFIKTGNFDGLRTLYKIGCEELAKAGKKAEIFTDYDWLLKIA